jgi:hypothetical protein
MINNPTDFTKEDKELMLRALDSYIYRCRDQEKLFKDIKVRSYSEERNSYVQKRIDFSLEIVPKLVSIHNRLTS